jgi:hypothetical protein
MVAQACTGRLSVIHALRGEWNCPSPREREAEASEPRQVGVERDLRKPAHVKRRQAVR